MHDIDPELRDFILFCLERHGKEWPGIYDEMVAVAAQRTYKGLGYEEMRRLGLSLAASRTLWLRQLVEYIASEQTESLNP